MGSAGGEEFVAKRMSCTVPNDPLQTPACCHRLDVSITSEFFAKKMTGSSPSASSNVAAEAPLPEFLALILAMGWPRSQNFSKLYPATLAFVKNSLMAFVNGSMLIYTVE